MKILIVTANYYPNVNGSSVFSQRLAHYLKQKGHDLLVMAASNKFRHETFSHNQIEIFGLRSLSLGWFYTGFRAPVPVGLKQAIRKEILRFNPDIIHLQDHFAISPTVVKVAKELGIPIIGTNHFMPENLVHYLHLPKPVENGVKRWAWRQFTKVYDQLHTVTTPTHIAAGLLKDVKLKKAVIPLSNGIDLTRFNPSNRGEYLRQRLDLPKVPTLLYVGRLDKEKNLDFIIRAMPEILKRTKLQFVIAGKGAEAAKLKQLVAALNLPDAVRFTGFIPDEDLPNLYTLADCFMIAGIAELQSIVTMEAMATGLPVVAVNAMALPELVVDGQNGFLFDEGNQKQLVDAIVKIFTNETLRKQMGQKGLVQIRVHDINVIIGRFEELYQSAQRSRHA